MDITTFPHLGMPEPELMADKQAIIELIGLERLWRDTGEWDLLAECYTPDAIVRTSWFKGTPSDFATQSKAMADQGRHGKHPMNPIYVLIDGDRALVESRAQILNRIEIEEVPVDLAQYVRFLSRVYRTDRGWRLSSFEGIYEKGTITPVDPTSPLPLDWADVISSTSRVSYQVHAWTLKRRGYTIPDDLLGDDRPDAVREFVAAEHRWLHGA